MKLLASVEAEVRRSSPSTSSNSSTGKWKVEPARFDIGYALCSIERLELYKDRLHLGTLKNLKVLGRTVIDIIRVGRATSVELQISLGGIQYVR